jgi:hypothetical protein
MREYTPRGPAFADDANACPFPKPFSPGFDECPAFTPVEFVPQDLRGRPLRGVLSCAHLVAARREGQVGTLFAACRLGNAEDRQAWADQRRPADAAE